VNDWVIEYLSFFAMFLCRVQAIFPTSPDQSVLRDQRMTHLVQYARKVEGDMYDSASSQVRIDVLPYA
jgi:hypothetical protein